MREAEKAAKNTEQIRLDNQRLRSDYERDHERINLLKSESQNLGLSVSLESIPQR